MSHFIIKYTGISVVPLICASVYFSVSYFVFFPPVDVSQTYGSRSQKKLAENIDWSYAGKSYRVVIKKRDNIYHATASKAEELSCQGLHHITQQITLSLIC